MKKVLSIIVTIAMLFSVYAPLTATAAGSTGTEVSIAGTSLNSPYGFSEEDEIVASQFVTTGSLLSVGVGCPSYSDNVGTLTLSIYSFNKDYATTIAGTAIKTQTYENFTDNAKLSLDFSDSPLAAGEYILTITDPSLISPGHDVGVWMEGVTEAQICWINGVSNDVYSLRMWLTYAQAPTDGKTYGTPTAPVIEGEENKPTTPYMESTIMCNDEEVESYMTGSQVEEILVNEGVLTFIVQENSNDPQLNITLPEVVDIEEYPYMLIRFRKAAGSPNSGEVFFNTDEFAGPTGGGSVTFPYQDTTEWQNVIVNFGSNAKAKGNLISMRYDVFPSTTTEAACEIEWITFFATKSAAESFDGDFAAFITPTPVPTPTPTPAPITPSPEATAEETAAATATASGTSTSDSDNNNTTTIIIVVGAAVVVAAGVGIAVVMSKKKK